MFDTIIIGAGPAGVSCAVWLKQLGFSPVLVDKNDQCGGLQLSNPYTNTWIATSANAYGKDVAAAMQANVVRHGIELRLGTLAVAASVTADAVAVNLAGGERLLGKFLVLAGGVSPKSGGMASRLGLLVGPGPAVASADFKGASVAVLGGGDSAFENYEVAANRGAASVTIFARSLKARSEMLAKVPPEDVIVGPYLVDQGTGAINGKKYDQVLVLYGYEASKSALLGLELAMRQDGYVATDPECLTSNPRVYATGELAARAHPCCVTAMADGVVTAKAIQRRLEASLASRYVGLVRRAASLGGKLLR